MKKYLLGFFAVVAALAMSAYSTNPAPKPNTTMTYWFYASDAEPAGTTSSPTISPLPSCLISGPGCVDGFESATPLTERPQRNPDAQFKQ